MVKGNSEKETHGHRKSELPLLKLCRVLKHPYITLSKCVQHLIRVKTCLAFNTGLLTISFQDFSTPVKRMSTLFSILHFPLGIKDNFCLSKRTDVLKADKCLFLQTIFNFVSGPSSSLRDHSTSNKMKPL